jgi:hypothetical protein
VRPIPGGAARGCSIIRCCCPPCRNRSPACVPTPGARVQQALLHRARVRRCRAANRSRSGWRRTKGVHAVQAQRLTMGHLQARMEVWATQGAQDGIEYRYPLLDRRLLEFCLGAPEELLQPTASTPRPLLRNAVRGLLPDSIRLANVKARASACGSLCGSARGQPAPSCCTTWRHNIRRIIPRQRAIWTWVCAARAGRNQMRRLQRTRWVSDRVGAASAGMDHGGGNSRRLRCQPPVDSAAPEATLRCGVVSVHQESRFIT